MRVLLSGRCANSVAPMEEEKRRDSTVHACCTATKASKQQITKLIRAPTHPLHLSHKEHKHGVQA